MYYTDTTTLPLPDLVGLDGAVRALLLLAVEPRLGGVVFAAPAGTGKSSLARGFASLMDGGQKTEEGKDILSSTVHRPPSTVELPASADEEALLGGLDLEATLRAGRRVAPGRRCRWPGPPRGRAVPPRSASSRRSRRRRRRRFPP